MKFQKKILIGFAALSAMGLAACSDTTSIKVDTDGGTTIDAIEVKDVKSLIDKLVTPTKAGHTFDGWYIDKDFKNKLDLEDKLSEIKTVYAKWIVGYKITFDTNGGTALAEMTAKDAATLITALKEKTITKANNTFAGWYTDFGLETALTETTEIKAAMTLYAKWTVNEFTVTFVTNGGTEVAPMSVKYDTVVPVGTAVTTKDGMDFAGWYTNEGLTGDAFVVGTTKVTAATTLYAKWAEKEKAQIGTADQLKAYLSSSYELDAELTADIDMKDVVLGDYAFAKDADGADTTAKVIFAKKFDGKRFKIKNLSSTKGLFSKLDNGAVVKDVVFENLTFNPTANNDSIIAASIDANKEAEISNVTFEGLTFKSKAGLQYTGILVGKLTGKLNANKITVIGKNAQDGKAKVETASYFGLVGQLAYSSGASAGGSLDASNIMIAADVTTADGITEQNGAQNVGGIIGQIHANCTASSVVNVDGYVFNGAISAGKNVGAVIGDFKSEAVLVSIKDTLVYATMSGIEKSGKECNTVGALIGLATDTNISNLTLNKCQIIDSSHPKVIIGGEKTQPTTGFTFVASEVAEAPNTNFEIGAERVVKFNGYETQLPASVTAQEVTKGKVSINDVLFEENPTVSGAIKWVAKTVSGKTAGPAVKITITKAADVVVGASGAYQVGEETASIPENGIIEYYLPITDELKGTNVTFKVKWSDAALEQEYTVAIASDITLATEPTQGAVAYSTTDGQNLTVAVNEADKTQLDVTAGNVVWNTTEGANLVKIEVTKPEWVTATDNPTIVGGKLVSYENNQAVIAVSPISKGENEVTVKWTNDSDPQQYTINVAEAVVIGKAEGLTKEEISLHDFLVEKGLTTDEAKAGIASVKISNTVTLLGGGKSDKRNDTWTFNTGGNGPDKGVKLHLDAEATVTIGFASGGEIRDIQFYTLNDGAKYSAVGSSTNTSTSDTKVPTLNTYTLQAGDYVFSGIKYKADEAGGIIENGYGGIRIFSITIDYTSNNA